MSTPLLCLIGYVLWTIALVALVAGLRGAQVLTGKAAPNAFPSGVQHGSDAYWRANRAHINAAENLPLFAAVVLVAAITSADTDPQFGTLAVATLCARIAQSVIHISSGSSTAVNLRFAAFCVQLGSLIWMALMIIRRAALLG